MPTSTEPGARDGAVLAVLLLTAATFRAWGLAFGLPHTLCRPDEEVVVSTAVRFFTGDLNPHFFNYPTAYLYLVAILDGIWFVVGRAAGWFTSVGQFVTEGLSRPAPLYLLARFLGVAAGTTTVWIVARIGRRVHSPRAGLLAAAMLALAFLHVRDSHFAVTDVTAGLFVMASLDFATMFVASGATRDLWLAALTAGLGASTKYNAALVVLPALWIVATSRSRRDRVRLAIVFGAVAAAAMVAGSPFVVLDLPHFVSDFTWEARHLRTGHGIMLGRGWIVHLASSLRYGVGLPILVAGIAGLAIAAWRDRRVGIAIAVFPVASYLALGSGYTVFARYMVPVVPFLCLGAAFLVADGASWIGRRADRFAGGLAWLLAAMLVAPSAIASWNLDYLLARTDNRVVAADWILREFPGATSVYQSGSLYGHVQLPPGMAAASTLAFDETTSTFRSPRGQIVAPPDLVVIQSSPLAFYSAVPPGLDRVLEDRYRLVRTFQACRTGVPGNVYDQSDAFFLPISGFAGVERPGPNLAVYTRGDDVSGTRSREAGMRLDTRAQNSR